MFDDYVLQWADPQGPMKALHAFHQWRMGWIDDRNILAPHARWLDVGCGIGLLCEDFSLRGVHIHGIDASKTLIDEAKKRSRQLALDISYEQAYIDRPADGGYSFYKPQSYDGICAFEILEHVASVPNTLYNIDALLKPGSLACISTFSKTWLAWFLGVCISENLGFTPKHSHNSGDFVSPYHVLFFFRQRGYRVGLQGLCYNPLSNSMVETASSYVHYFLWAQKPLNRIDI